MYTIWEWLVPSNMVDGAISRLDSFIDKAMKCTSEEEDKIVGANSSESRLGIPSNE